ncbi:hypothetical protein I4J89_41405 [Actinoplanes sp. NEAU-A11]|uniref:Uncharacterized protein n=2 Tax=Actinoplanes aureus TaxID=2792083 RepID=A0A931CH56_9ACTN|nr:hypothetical protein [Actinoplanes aureus]
MQASAWANKLAKGFNTSDVAVEFGLLYGEIAEAFEAWRHRRTESLTTELADAAIYLLSLAQMTGVDLQGAITSKLAVNAGREYRRDPASGSLVKVKQLRCPLCDSTDHSWRSVIDEGEGPFYCDHDWHDAEGSTDGGDVR